MVLFRIEPVSTPPDIASCATCAHATTPEVGPACRTTPGEARARLARLESRRLITGRQDARLIAQQARAFMIAGRQTREARALLGLHRSELAATVRVISTATIRRAESVDGEPPITMAQAAIQKAFFERAGIDFTFADEGGSVARKDTP